MNPNEVTFKAITLGAAVPKRHSDGAAGYDIYSVEGGEIPPKSISRIRTGFSLNVPFNILGLIMGRSGLAVRKNLEVSCSYIKNGEEVVIYMYNGSEEPFRYDPNERLAQLVFLKLDNSDICYHE